MFESVKDMAEAVASVATVAGDAITVTQGAALSADVIDRLAWTAAFGASPEVKGAARWIIRSVAAAAGWASGAVPTFPALPSPDPSAVCSLVATAVAAESGASAAGAASTPLVSCCACALIS